VPFKTQKPITQQIGLPLHNFKGLPFKRGWFEAGSPFMFGGECQPAPCWSLMLRLTWWTTGIQRQRKMDCMHHILLNIYSK